MLIEKTSMFTLFWVNLLDLLHTTKYTQFLSKLQNFCGKFLHTVFFFFAYKQIYVNIFVANVYYVYCEYHVLCSCLAI